VERNDSGCVISQTKGPTAVLTRKNQFLSSPKYFPHPASFSVFFSLSVRFILVGMARRLHNWSYNNVTDFLKEKGFTFYREVGGSHQAWIKRGKDKAPDRIIGINFTHGSYLVGTMKRMIRESGIDQDVWIKWSGS
jgi:hypothetical protein